MDKDEKRICLYSTLLIVFMLNTPKLLALRAHGIVAQYWHFNLAELLFQVAANLLFCWLFVIINLKPSLQHHLYRGRQKKTLFIGLQIVVFFVFLFTGGLMQRLLFLNQQLPRIYWLGYFSRLFLSVLLIGVMIKIVLLLRESKKKEIEHEQLKTAYMTAELELLKEQINPHFLFNSLSSLSGIIREDPNLAQQYVKELSNVFRYTLVHSKNNLVTVREELNMLQSFARLISMRLEGAFKLNVTVDDSLSLFTLPHLSLQPLLENAVKHNAATKNKPLIVHIYTEDNYVVMSNNVQKIWVPEFSNGIGLANLNERFKIMMNDEIEIVKTDVQFKVKLPLRP